MPLSARPPPFSLCAARTAQRTIAEEGIQSVKTEQSTFAHYDLRKDEQRHAAGYRCEANAKSLAYCRAATGSSGRHGTFARVSRRSFLHNGHIWEPAPAVQDSEGLPLISLQRRPGSLSWGPRPKRPLVPAHRRPRSTDIGPFISHRCAPWRTGTCVTLQGTDAPVALPDTPPVPRAAP